MKKLDDLCRIDTSLAPVLETLKSAAIGVDEASFAIRDYLDRLEADPDRLEHVESRLELIDKLKRKYGSSLAEVLAFLENVREQIPAVETAGERKAKLEQDAGAVERGLSRSRRVAHQTAQIRRGEAARKVEGELGALALENAVFQIAVQPANWSAHGADRVEFLISANAGEEPRPLDKVASGGELSRIALALKTSAGRARARERRAANVGFR